MGSANGCCRNPNVDNNVVAQGGGSTSYGGAWGDRKTFSISQQNGSEVTENGGRNGHAVSVGLGNTISHGLPGLGPPPMEMPRGDSTVSDKSVDSGSGHSTSKAIGSVLFMFMNTFSHQPRDLLIALGGGGSQLVRPASFKLEDSETVKTATTTEIAQVDVASEVVVTSGLNVPEDPPPAPPMSTWTSRDRRRSSAVVVNPGSHSTVLIPPDVHNAAMSRIINSLTTFPNRRGSRSRRSSSDST